jgi:hypothetical protein
MSCLFVAIGRHVGLSHALVRHDVCNYLQTHTMLDYMGFPLGWWMCRQNEWDGGGDHGTELTWDEERSLIYITKMREKSTWGGAMEIAICSHMYSCNIIVHSPGMVVVAEFITPNSMNDLHLTWNGVHFE